MGRDRAQRHQGSDPGTQNGPVAKEETVGRVEHQTTILSFAQRRRKPRTRLETEKTTVPEDVGTTIRPTSIIIRMEKQFV